MKSLLSPPLSGMPETPYEVLVENAEAALPELPDDPSEVLIALDIDGTILHPSGATPKVLETLAAARDLGINISIATGRGMASAAPVIRELRLDDSWTICSNGALTLRWDGGPVIETEHTFDPRGAGEAILAAIPNVLLAADESMRGLLVSSPFPKGELMFEVLAGHIDQILDVPVTKLVARAPDMSRQEFVDLLTPLPLDDVQVAIGWTSWADVGPLGVTKASALSELAERLEVPSQGTVAIGDGMNDIDMLRWAAHGVAMGGSDPEVIAAAKVETGPVEQDGAAAVVEAIVERFRA